LCYSENAAENQAAPQIPFNFGVPLGLSSRLTEMDTDHPEYETAIATRTRIINMDDFYKNSPDQICERDRLF